MSENNSEFQNKNKKDDQNYNWTLYFYEEWMKNICNKQSRKSSNPTVNKLDGVMKTYIYYYYIKMH